MNIAYLLRSPDKKGIEMRDMGSFAGQLLIHSFDRAEQVYNAMKCRGYTSGYSQKNIPQKKENISTARFYIFIYRLLVMRNVSFY